MRPWNAEMRGRLDELSFESAALRNNPLKDPATRPLWVWVPPEYDRSDRRYPSIYVLQGLTGQLDMWRNRLPFRDNPIELADELFSSGDVPECILVWVDCWTSLGGSQFLDSPGTGRYHTYLCDEIVPFVDRKYRTLAKAAHRGVSGKSSGGYGAMVTPMLRPDLFGGLATHAGDALFEHCYFRGFGETVRTLRDNYGGSFDRFWDDFRTRPALAKDTDMSLLNTWCMSACYSTDKDGTVQIPVDLATGELRTEVWKRWLAWDPPRMVERYRDAMRGMKAIYIDAGRRDEWFLDLGAEAFRAALERIGVNDVFFGIFEGTHKAIEYRYPIAWKYLASRLAPR